MSANVSTSLRRKRRMIVRLWLDDATGPLVGNTRFRYKFIKGSYAAPKMIGATPDNRALLVEVGAKWPPLELANQRKDTIPWLLEASGLLRTDPYGQLAQSILTRTADQMAQEMRRKIDADIVATLRGRTSP